MSYNQEIVGGYFLLVRPVELTTVELWMEEKIQQGAVILLH